MASQYGLSGREPMAQRRETAQPTTGAFTERSEKNGTTVADRRTSRRDAQHRPLQDLRPPPHRRARIRQDRPATPHPGGQRAQLRRPTGRGVPRVSARANGEGTVYQRKDGRWCAAAHVPVAGGGTRRVFAYGSTRQDANRKLRDLLDRADKHIPAAPAGLTVDAYLDEWLAHIRQHARPTTYAG